MYQLIWHELVWVVGIYYTISVMYRHILIPYYPTAKENFELFCAFCKKFDSPVPVTFLTGILDFTHFLVFIINLKKRSHTKLV